MKPPRRDVTPYSQAICDLDTTICNIRRKNQLFETKYSTSTPKQNHSLPKTPGKKKPLDMPTLEIEQ